MPKVADPLSPITFVNKINVPVFMACQWTDEQTGGHCPTWPSTSPGRTRKWFTFTNGTHVDSLDPETFNRWYDFLELYVAQQAPITNSAAIHAAAPVIYQEAMGITGVTLPPDPIQLQPTYAGALAAFEQLPADPRPVRQRRRRPQPGQPQPGFEQSFASFPIPGTTARSWYLGERAARSRDDPPAAGGGGRVHVERPRPAADRLHRRHRGGHRAACGPRRRRTTGRRPPAGQRGVLPDQAR